MAAQQERLRIDVLPPTGRAMSQASADEAIRALARLIGRQIAREEFQRAVAQERMSKRSKAPPVKS